VHCFHLSEKRIGLKYHYSSIGKTTFAYTCESLKALTNVNLPINDLKRVEPPAAEELVVVQVDWTVCHFPQKTVHLKKLHDYS
jgi:hypothetical protein